ncbi:MAG TPA: thioredoxin family protein [Gemmataceae bacterium]|nr:thioredoxin family protein [Gemmataceae bacterium]
MDRSYLSRPEIIAASRDFVCVRLTTYEDKEEGLFLKSFRVTRSGELENTVFTILSPDGKKQLARASRSAQNTFGDVQRMAETMKRIAGEYPAKKTAVLLAELPRVRNVALAVNVAACDNQPLVILFAAEDRVRQDLEKRLLPLAWNEPLRGRFIYVSASNAAELARIDGARAEAGVIVVEPDRFGTKGKLLQQIGASASRDELTKCLQKALSQHKPSDKSFGSHVRQGQLQGVFWETVLPVTDPMELRARERGRRLNPSRK